MLCRKDLWLFVIGTAVTVPSANAQLNESQVLVLVNANSPVSREVAKIYRQYHPDITDQQVLYLSGLRDSASRTSTPADEILTRSEFDAWIGGPVRDYLVENDMVNSVYCIITTAGMPYRIEDSNPSFSSVVDPGASNPTVTFNNRTQVSAASVESELSVLFLVDPTVTGGAGLPMPLTNRLINPYHGYTSSIVRWQGLRNILSRRMTFRWTYAWLVSGSPRFEGLFDSTGRSALDRRMSPADIYLTARLDGPRRTGEYPLFSVRKMLDRAARASNPHHPRFVGYNAQDTFVVIDHAPMAPNFVQNSILNFPPTHQVGGQTVPLRSLTFEEYPVPPTSNAINAGDDYWRTFYSLVGMDAYHGEITAAQFIYGLGGNVYLDDTSALMNQVVLRPGAMVLGTSTFGRNGDDNRPANYLTRSGPASGPLFKLAAGAFFSSEESYNAVTMFTDVTTNQGKTAEFFAIGGTIAVGYAFEPVSDALVDKEFFFQNLLRDDNGDGRADLTAVEAAFAATPYLSWAHVFLGDPLVRLRVGAGATMRPAEPGDANGDGVVDPRDSLAVTSAMGRQLGNNLYNDRADQNEDGRVDFRDYWTVLDYFGVDYNVPDDPGDVREQTMTEGSLPIILNP